MENVVDRLLFLSATQCDISTELEFIASHFYAFLSRRDALNVLPFSLIYAILSHGSLRLESEDGLYEFIRRGIEMNGEMFGLFEFIRLEYCSTDAMNDFLDLFLGHSHEINASMWAGVRARLVLPNINMKQPNEFPPSMKKAKTTWGREYDVPDGIIAHLTRECGGNVHNCHVVDVTCGSFEKETLGANPHSGAFYNYDDCVAKNAADLDIDSDFYSAFRCSSEVPHTRNNWICYDFKERRIVPTHYTIRTNWQGPGKSHLKSWLIETSADGENWREVAREENNEQLNGHFYTATFAVAGGGKCTIVGDRVA
jgi:hypothetical protein